MYLFRALETAILPLCFLALAACSDYGTTLPPEKKVSQMILIRHHRDSLPPYFDGYYMLSIWSGNKIYCARPLREITLDQEYHSVRDTMFAGYILCTFIASNTSGTEQLIVVSPSVYSSGGTLYSRDVTTGTWALLKDSSFVVSSARFLNHVRKCVYYSYGNRAIGLAPGYYLYDFASGTDTLLLPYSSVTGRDEVLNGFDIRHDDRKLLYPLHYADDYPRAVSYDLQTGLQDTMSVGFERQFLWLRYHPDDSQILYSNYPYGVTSYSVYDTSEVGIIDVATGQKRVLSVNTNPSWKSVNVFAEWSSDGKHIVYASALGPALEPEGAVGRYSVYVLTNVN